MVKPQRSAACHQVPHLSSCTTSDSISISVPSSPTTYSPLCSAMLWCPATRSASSLVADAAPPLAAAAGAAAAALGLAEGTSPLLPSASGAVTRASCRYFRAYVLRSWWQQRCVMHDIYDKNVRMATCFGHMTVPCMRLAVSPHAGPNSMWHADSETNTIGHGFGTAMHALPPCRCQHRLVCMCAWML